MSLNKEQEIAATTLNGPVLILAAAGTGKTHTLVSRLENAINSGINPSNILMLTFTNKAANEMVERAEKEMNGKILGLTACTFHSFCVKIIYQFAQRVGLKKGFTLLTGGDSSDAMALAKAEMLERMKSSDLPEERAIAASITGVSDFPNCSIIKNVFSKSINTQTSLKACLAMDKRCSDYIEECVLICKEYVSYKKAHDMLDYDDLMLRFIQIMDECPDAADFIRAKYQFIMVDEFQDTNGIQLDMITRLCPPERGNKNNICVVGDDFQSIYGFRGANFKNILNFPKLYEGTKVVILSRNYRSNQEILDMANAVVHSGAEKFDKGMNTDVFKYEKPVLRINDDSNIENYEILTDIKDRLKRGESPKSMCVLIRNAADSFELEAMLASEKIPYEKLGGIKLFDKVYVRDIFAFLKVTYNPKDELAWFRLFQLYYGIGSVNGKKLTVGIVENGVNELINPIYASKVYGDSLFQLYTIYCKLLEMDFAEQLDYIMDYYFEHMYHLINDRIGKSSEKDKDLNQLEKDEKESPVIKELAEDFKSAQDFINAVAIETPEKKAEVEKVTISTIHSAKGLEWETIYMMNCVSGKYPRASASKEEVEEERRVFYVAVTRAKDNLILYAPRRTKFYGRFTQTSPTQYLEESGLVKNSYTIM